MGFSVLLMTTWTCQGLPTCWKMQGTTHAMAAMSQCSQEPVNSSLHISICCRYATQTTDVSHRTLHTLCVNYMYRQWCTHWILVETTSQPVHFIWQEVLALGGPHWQRTSGHLMSSRRVAQKHIHLPCCRATVHVHTYVSYHSACFPAADMKHAAWSSSQLMVSLLLMIPVLPRTMKSLT